MDPCSPWGTSVFSTRFLNQEFNEATPNPNDIVFFLAKKIIETSLASFSFAPRAFRNRACGEQIMSQSKSTLFLWNEDVVSVKHTWIKSFVTHIISFALPCCRNRRT
jgi:hypothetical protein